MPQEKDDKLDPTRREARAQADEPRQFTALFEPDDLNEWPHLKQATRAVYNGRMIPWLGKYPLIKQLGIGGMGAVYYTLHPRLPMHLAVKVLRSDIFKDGPNQEPAKWQAAINRFMQEAENAALIDSKNVIRILDVGEDHGQHYIVMEFVRGKNAMQLLHSAIAQGAPGLEESVALEIVYGACIGLKAAHDIRIIHRDIKPDNILVPYSGDADILDFPAAKLGDLGLAKHELKSHGNTMPGAAMGTPGYMPLEQYEDAKKAGKPADVFAMGATLYALLAGQSPFKSDLLSEYVRRTANDPHRPIREIRNDVSAATARIIDRCLHKVPAGRFPDATVLLTAISQALGPLTASPAPPRRVETKLAPTKLEANSVDGARPRTAFITPPITPFGESRLDLGSGVQMEFVHVTSGAFSMGSDDGKNGEGPVHAVRITKEFLIGKYPVTVRQFERFVKASQYVTDAESGRGEARGGFQCIGKQWKWTPTACWKTPGFKQTDRHPVVMVSWNDAQKFVQWLAKTCKCPVRLPYEAEWEYAARGTNGHTYPWGDKFDGARCNHADQVLRKSGQAPDTWQFSTEVDGYSFTSPVGQFKNESWCKAFDMAGNVWQWCHDWYSEQYYQDSPQEDPAGPPEGAARVLRGGSWGDKQDACRAFSRSCGAPSFRAPTFGFRIALDRR